MALAHLAQLAQPAHLARLSRPGSGLGRSTDPAQPPRASLSPPRALWWPSIAAATAWPLRPTPVSFAVATLGKILPPISSPTSTKQIRRPPPLRWDLRRAPAREPDSLSPPQLIPHRLPPDVCCASLGWSWWGCAVDSVGGRVGASQSSPGGVAPRAAAAALVKSSPGHAWLAARALPRHAGQVGTWAMVSNSYSSLLPSTFSCPQPLTIWSVSSAPSFQLSLWCCCLL
jgi:hypothetical protein